MGLGTAAVHFSPLRKRKEPECICETENKYVKSFLEEGLEIGLAKGCQKNVNRYRKAVAVIHRRQTVAKCRQSDRPSVELTTYNR